MRGRVRRLARDLPLLECVWVDALAQARLLTPLQAAQINAGRAKSLIVGPYLLLERLHGAAIGDEYLVRSVKDNQVARLLTIPSAEDSVRRVRQLQECVERTQRPAGCVVGPSRAGRTDERVWVAAEYQAGPTAAQWMVRYGRFPAEAVLEIARQMLAGLAAFEARAHLHGDLRADTLAFGPGGRVVLSMAGVRGILRPQEGFADANLPPEAYDGLAPERVTDGTPPQVSSDLYACGCLWWHLLTGRSPQPGGNAQAKLLSVQSGRINDVRQLAPETPAVLAEAITACTARDPADRPEAFAALRSRLGAPTARGRRTLARCLGDDVQPRIWPGMPESRTNAGKSGLRSWAAAAAALLLIGAATWPLWRGRTPGSSVAAATLPARGATNPDAADPGPSVRQLPDETPTAEPQEPARPADSLLLPVDEEVHWQDVRLRDGLTVRGDGGRPLILVSAGGLVVDRRDVRFEQVDFLWRANAEQSPEPPATALVSLRGEGTRFVGCTFQVQPAAAATTTPVAIDWQNDAAGDAQSLALPLGVLEFQDCVFRGVGAAIDCHVAGAVAVRMHNCLHLGPGPLLRLHRCLLPDEPLTLQLSRCTLRGGESVLHCRYASTQRPGRLSLRAEGCVFVPSGRGALFMLDGAQPPDSILDAWQWSGRSSVLESEAAVARWNDGSGRLLLLDEAGLAITGVVRSRLEFAGPADGSGSAAELTRWNVPLRSTHPPGVSGTLPPLHSR